MPRFDIDDLEQRDSALVQVWIDRLGPVLDACFHPVVQGLDRVPEGAAMYVGNHSGGMLTPDSFVLFRALADEVGLSALPYGLGHEVMLSTWPFNNLIVPLGAVRACRENGLALLSRGRKIMIYPGGEAEVFRAHSRRNKVDFRGRRGYARLAIEGGVPIIPVASAGGHSSLLIVSQGRRLAKAIGAPRHLRMHSWPLTLSVPWGVTLGPVPPHIPIPTRIHVEVLEPVQLSRVGVEAAADEAYVTEVDAVVRDRIQTALTRLAGERRDVSRRHRVLRSLRERF
ncbi:MAG: 1-acyl-sn-glycerol-3-phosphate acyltransferase [Kiritimatiellia bacterium]|jgi:1-acyl-sn-glycerol-3-phosphate acyltransferase